MSDRFLTTIKDPNTCITPIDSAVRFPEVMDVLLEKYGQDVDEFCTLISRCKSSAEMLDLIRSPHIPAGRRMSLLKMFRRCVAPVLDTETTKKITTISTRSLVENFGTTFKPIEKLKTQFSSPSKEMKAALAVLIGEYDSRGQVGYQLTEVFFDWFERKFKGSMTIEGPRRAGRDIELRTIFPEFEGAYPCDFVIRDKKTGNVLAVGFARYDSTRGGAQSDDRTGGNSYKVAKAEEFERKTGKRIRLLFLADGPGLGHRDTWEEACLLDGMWNGNVRVTTLKLADKRVSEDWLRSR